MLADERQSVRLRALSLISDVPGPHKERNFVLPQANPNAKDYTKMISLKYELAIPPLLRGRVNLTEIELSPLWFDDISCHSQAVERIVSVVTQAAELNLGYQSRHQTILNCLKSRKILPTFESKEEWVSQKSTSDETQIRCAHCFNPSITIRSECVFYTIRFLFSEFLQK